MNNENAFIYADDLFSSSRPPLFSPRALVTLWKSALFHSRVPDHHKFNWMNSLEYDNPDPFVYWVQCFHTQPDGKDCADAILVAMQEIIDGQDKSTDSCRIMRYILLKFAMECQTVPSSLFIQDLLIDHTIEPALGGFSDVFRGSVNGETVAVKRLRVLQHKDSSFDKMLHREALIWRQIKHPRILPFLGLCETGQPPRSCMISPWMHGGSLASLLKSQPDIDVLNKGTWIWEICDGMQYLHKICLYHGDLRGANILLDAEQHAVIADLGLAQCMDAGDSTMNMTNRTGTIRWTAPEVLENEQCTFASDVYSFACTCLEIVTQEHPFPEYPMDRLVRRHIRQGNSPKWPCELMSTTLVDIGLKLEPCFGRDPQSRPSMDALACSLKLVSLSGTVDEGFEHHLRDRSSYDDVHSQTTDEYEVGHGQDVDDDEDADTICTDTPYDHDLNTVLQKVDLNQFDPQYAELGQPRPVLREVTEKLQTLSAKAYRLSAEIPVEDRTWGKMLGTLTQTFVAEPIAKTDQSSLTSNLDPAVGKEVGGWLKGLINNEDAWEATKANLKTATEIIANADAAVEPLRGFLRNCS